MKQLYSNKDLFKKKKKDGRENLKYNDNYSKCKWIEVSDQKTETFRRNIFKANNTSFITDSQQRKKRLKNEARVLIVGPMDSH